MYYLEYLKKYLWLLRIAVVTLTAFLAANAVSINIRGRLSETPTMDLSQIAGGSSAYVPLTDYEIIVKRSLFYAAGMNMAAGFAKAESPLQTAEDFELLGTIAGLPRDSYAAIRTRSDGLIGVYKINDEIGKSKAIVLDIQPRVVVLEHNGQEKVIKMAGSDDVRVARRWDSRSMSERIDEGIAKMGEGEFTLSRDLVEDAFDNIGSLMRGARIVPKLDKGQIVGIKVFRIKKDSLYSKIGLKNGDVIHRINSVDFKGPEDILKVFTELRSASSINIDITRDNQRQTLNYQVR